MKVLINFADERYKKAQELNTKTAKLFCKFDKIYSFSPLDISKEFYEKNKKILDCKRGCGLWLWKPYFIYKVLQEQKEGDIVFYCDSGAYFFRNVSPILKILKKQDIWVSILPFIEKQFTKKKTFEIMNCEDEKYKNSNQISATFIAVKKSDFSMKFIKEWLDYSCNYENISPVEDKTEEVPEFYSHREDQSILSLLVKKYNIKAYSDPSQFGRVPETYYIKDCAMNYYGKQDYPICIVHHRQDIIIKKKLFKLWLHAVSPRNITLKMIYFRKEYMMIKAVFGGGLGNQMFLYAYIYAQIKKNNLYPSIYAVMHRNNNEDKRNFSLSTLNCSIDMNVVEEKDAKLSTKFKIAIRERIFIILRKFHIKEEKIIKIFKMLNICFPPGIFKYYPNLKLKHNEYVEGTFQTWKYFDDYKKELVNEFKVTKEISSKNQEILNNIKSTNSVCVHIRRGDYLNSYYSKTLQVCNYNYYKNAMDYIASKVDNPIFYIFSNTHEDHEWIKKNYKFDYNIVYVDNDNPDYEELRLMYSCKHFIISNSTFSWWAQYLSENDKKEVVAPSKWFLGKDDAQDIYMPNWHIVDV